MPTNPAILRLAQAYNKAHGLPAHSVTPSTLAEDVPHSQATAQFYDRAVHSPSDPAVKSAYGAFKQEVLDQYNHIKPHVSIVHSGTEDPYPDANSMIRDVAANKRLAYYPTQPGQLPADHPLAETAPNGLLYNDMFRTVHDYFGHAMHGHSFDKLGEKRAWDEHSQMFTPSARQALTTETHGQNSWLHYGPKSHIPEKPYAEQKAIVLPSSLQPGHRVAKLSRTDDTAADLLHSYHATGDHVALAALADHLLETGHPSAGIVKALYDSRAEPYDIHLSGHSQHNFRENLQRIDERKSSTDTERRMDGVEGKKFVYLTPNLHLGMEFGDNQGEPSIRTYTYGKDHKTGKQTWANRKIVYPDIHTYHQLAKQVGLPLNERAALRLTHPITSTPRDEAIGRRAAQQAKFPHIRNTSPIVSTNDRRGLGSAVPQMTSRNENVRLQLIKKVLHEASLHGTPEPALYIDKDSRPSVVTKINHDNEPETIDYLGAWYGTLAQEPRLTVFHSDSNGADKLHILDTPAKPELVQRALQASGITGASLAGTKLHLFDPAGKLTEQITHLGKLLGAQHSITNGIGRRIGSNPGKPGTPATQGADARKSYRDVISQFEKSPGN